MDVVGLVVHLVEKMPRQQNYILCDSSQCTLASITSAISASVGLGSTSVVEVEEGFKLPGLTTMHFDLLTSDIRLQSCARES